MKNNEFKRICKETVIEALKREYGFAPQRKADITLLEASENRNYILFAVNEVEYRFDSYHLHGVDGKDWGVWCGKGTISKCEA